MEFGARRGPSPRAPLCAWSPARPGTAGCRRPRSAGGWRRWQHGRPGWSRLPAATTACGPGPSGPPRTGPDESVDRLQGPPCLPRTGSDSRLVYFSSGSATGAQYVGAVLPPRGHFWMNACACLSRGSQSFILNKDVICSTDGHLLFWGGSRMGGHLSFNILKKKIEKNKLLLLLFIFFNNR